MGFSLYNIEGEEVTNKDKQNKAFWYKHGMEKESVFVYRYRRLLGVSINPEKKENPLAPDLLNVRTNKLGDLKTQNTPFFQSRDRFNIDPQYAVTFNIKDRNRYTSRYPDIDIYFAIDWQIVCMKSNYREYHVNPMIGIWCIPFKNLIDILDTTKNVHQYSERKSDTEGNAKSSYVIDLEQHTNFRLV